MQKLNQIKGLFLVFFLFTLIACQTNGKKDQITQLKGEVMAAHDEVMPKMGKMRSMEKSLRALSANDLDSLEIRKEADALKIANDGMMQWMRNYQPDFEGTEDEYIQYLQEQKKLIEKVREDINSSLATGETRLNQ